MRSRLFNVAALASVILCVLALASWVVSHYRYESFVVQGGSRSLRGAIHHGLLVIGVYRDDPAMPRLGRVGRPLPFQGLITPQPFEVMTYSTGRSIALPLWLLSGLFAITPVAWLIRRRLGRPRAGLCAACGYDLRGTPGSECPECGVERAG
jgi:hypothetical protein